jgi:hypothetical protein
MVPDDRARARVQRDDVRVCGVDEDLVAIDRDRAHRLDRAIGALIGALVFPEEIAGGGVERLHAAAGIGDEHHAVMDERGGLARACVQRP